MNLDRRSTIDLVFTQRMICEKKLEFSKRAYKFFVDSEKSFDRVSRGNLWTVLGKKEYEVPCTLVRAIKNTYVESLCKIKPQMEKSEWFGVWVVRSLDMP